jgi:hypothetical protein
MSSREGMNDKEGIANFKMNLIGPQGMGQILEKAGSFLGDTRDKINQHTWPHDLKQ